MGRVSKRIIDQNLIQELEEQLMSTISSLQDKSEIAVFLEEFLTKEEKIMLGKRLTMYMLIYRGFTNAQICRILSLSQDTVRWYKVMFERKPNMFKRTIERLLQRKKTKELWEKIEKILEPVGLAIESRSNMKARAKLASGDFWKG